MPPILDEIEEEDFLDDADEEDEDGGASPEGEADEHDDEDDGQGEPERSEEDEDGEDEEDTPDDKGEDDEFGKDSVNDRGNSRQRRSQNRFQTLANDKKALEERLAKAERDLQTRAEQEQRQSAEASRLAQLERETHLATLTPEERNALEIKELRGQIRYQEDMNKFRQADIRDAAEYKATAKVNPLYQRHAAAVEKSLAQLRGQGQNMPREALLRYHIGEEMLKNSQKSSKQLTPQKTRKVPKPNNSRADVSSSQGKRKSSSERDALRKRLENIEL